jgi:hypothetical protein
MPKDNRYDRLKVTFLIKGGSLACALETATEIIAPPPGTNLQTAFSYFCDQGLWLDDEDRFIPPHAIIAIERCDERGFTRKQREQMAFEDDLPQKGR